MGPQLLKLNLQLRVVKPRPIRVALVGEVEHPGLYSLSTSETTQTECGPSISISGLPTVSDAIQKAGRIMQQADLRQVLLQRRLPGDEVKYKQAQLDLLALIQGGRQFQNPYLFDGDVPLATAQETPKEAIELAAQPLAEADHRLHRRRGGAAWTNATDGQHPLGPGDHGGWWSQNLAGQQEQREVAADQPQWQCNPREVLADAQPGGLQHALSPLARRFTVALFEKGVMP